MTKNKTGLLVYLVFPISQIMIFIGVFLSVGGLDFNGVLGITASLLADAFILFLFAKLGRLNQVKAERREAEVMLRAEEKRNQEIARSQEEMLTLRQELAQAFEELKEKLRTGDSKQEREEVLSAFQERLERTREEEYCSNPIVNAIVSSKKKYIEEELKLKLEVDIRIMEELQVEDLDLCSIFSNLLDNAAEATKEFGGGEIGLSATINQGYLVVKVTNPASREHAGRSRRTGHGFGSRILEDIAKKYRGSFKRELKNQVYTATVIVNGKQ